MRISQSAALSKSLLATQRRAVYDHDGHERLGDITQTDDGIVARTRCGSVIGVFGTTAAAINAVATAARAS